MTTLRAILFGDDNPAAAASGQLEAAAERLAGVGAVPPQQEATPVAMTRLVMTRLAELLNFEVSDLLVGAWRTRSILVTAARESLAEPTVARQVTLSTYAFPWDYEVDLDVTLHGATLTTISLAAGVQVEVTGLAATIQNGRITALLSGQVKVGAAVRIASRTAVPLGMPLAQGERTLPMQLELRLPATGLSLVDQ